MSIVGMIGPKCNRIHVCQAKHAFYEAIRIVAFDVEIQNLGHFPTPTEFEQTKSKIHVDRTLVFVQLNFKTVNRYFTTEQE